jgi:magnesium-protoporphyrin O-methyltransferase
VDPDAERPNCCFDEWASSNAKRARQHEVAAPLTRALLDELQDTGFADRSVLDVGCGTGDLALAMIGRGASGARGIDLGRGAIEAARGLAAERGLTDRAAFEVGDASTAPLPQADVVVLHRVVCCYPDASGLLANTLASARAVYAFTAPVDRGVMGWLNRGLVAISNRWYSLRASRYRGFRTYVHALDEIDATVRAAGFTPRRRTRRRAVWELAVYTR